MHDSFSSRESTFSFPCEFCPGNHRCMFILILFLILRFSSVVHLSSGSGVRIHCQIENLDNDSDILITPVVSIKPSVRSPGHFNNFLRTFRRLFGRENKRIILPDCEEVDQVLRNNNIANSNLILSRSDNSWILELFPYLDFKSRTQLRLVSKEFLLKHILHHRYEVSSAFKPRFQSGFDCFYDKFGYSSMVLLDFTPSINSFMEEENRVKYYDNIIVDSSHTSAGLTDLEMRFEGITNLVEYFVFLLAFFKCTNQILLWKYIEMTVRTNILDYNLIRNSILVNMTTTSIFKMAVFYNLPYLIATVLEKEKEHLKPVNIFHCLQICTKYSHFEAILSILYRVDKFDQSFPRLLQTVYDSLIKCDQLPILDEFLKDYSKFMMRNSSELLITAIQYTNFELLEILLKHFDVHVVMNKFTSLFVDFQFTPVGLSIIKNDIPIFNLIFTSLKQRFKADTEYYDTLLFDSIYCAILFSSIDVLKYLLIEETTDRGGVLNAFLESSLSLTSLIVTNSNENILDLFFSRRDVEDIILREFSPFDLVMMSAKLKSSNTLEFYINRFGQELIEIKNIDGMTPFLTAASMGRSKICKFIIGIHPDAIHETDPNGNNAFHLAIGTEQSVIFLGFLISLNVDYRHRNNENVPASFMFKTMVKSNDHYSESDLDTLVYFIHEHRKSTNMFQHVLYPCLMNKFFILSLIITCSLLSIRTSTSPYQQVQVVNNRNRNSKRSLTAKISTYTYKSKINVTDNDTESVLQDTVPIREVLYRPSVQKMFSSITSCICFRKNIVHPIDKTAKNSSPSIVYFSDLPFDILWAISTFLSDKQVVELACLSKRFLHEYTFNVRTQIKISLRRFKIVDGLERLENTSNYIQFCRDFIIKWFDKSNRTRLYTKILPSLTNGADLQAELDLSRITNFNEYLTFLAKLFYFFDYAGLYWNFINILLKTRLFRYEDISSFHKWDFSIKSVVSALDNRYFSLASHLILNYKRNRKTFFFFCDEYDSFYYIVAKFCVKNDLFDQFVFIVDLMAEKQVLNLDSLISLIESAQRPDRKVFLQYLHNKFSSSFLYSVCVPMFLKI